jgi:hypothetical protein
MRRRVQIFISGAFLAGCLLGAIAIEDQIWYYDNVGDTYTPDWVHYLAVSVALLGLLSPILTWPRPLWLPPTWGWWVASPQPTEPNQPRGDLPSGADMTARDHPVPRKDER